jgi:hypothetical protein
MLYSPMKSARGKVVAREPNYTDILESENNVVSAIEKNVIEVPLNIMRKKKAGRFEPWIKSFIPNTIVMIAEMNTTKTSWDMK